MRSLTWMTVLGLAGIGHAQTTWHVDINGTPPGTGTQADPYTSIQFAIAQASTVAGDTILVEPGKYVENLDFLGKDITVQSTAGREQTVVDGNDIASVVSFANGETAAAVLDGFTLQNGLGTSESLTRRGGGIYADEASPTLRNLDVRNNVALEGAGIYLNQSSAWITDSLIHNNQGPFCAGSFFGMGILASGTPLVERCEIYANTTGTLGGGIRGSGTYRECIIRGNQANQGGAASAGGGSLEFFDCLIENNAAFNCDTISSTGGVYGPATLTRCILVDNEGRNAGGGASFCTLIDCTVRGNSVRALNGGFGSARGGGTWECDLYNCEVFDNEVVSSVKPMGAFGGGIDGGSATDCKIYGNSATCTNVSFGAAGGGGAAGADLVRCEIYDNVVVEANQVGTGGGIAFSDAERCTIYGNVADIGGGAHLGTLTHCVVSDNMAHVSEGGVAEADSLLNTIVWNNDPPATTATSVTYSLIEGGFAGVGNLSSSPRFYGPQAHDFRLKSDSPCIDAGDPTSPADPDTSVADMGVYPFDASYCPPARPYCVAKVNSQGCTPRIFSSGLPSLSGDNNFVVRADEVRNRKIGILFYGTLADETPFFGGTLCVGGTLRRYGAEVSGGSPPGQQDCTGTYSFPVTQARLAAAGIASPQTIHLQILYRDPPHPDGTGAGLTDALEATICP